MQSTVTFVLIICCTLCCGAAVDWSPKFADTSKGWVDCGPSKTIHMEEVKWVSGNCTAFVTDFYRNYCEGKHNCDLRSIVPQEFGCHKEGRPTLYYTSTCMEATFPFEFISVKQGDNQRIDCGSDKVIYIHYANYTSLDGCGYNVHISVDGLCGRKHNCDLNPALYGKNGGFTFDNYYGVKCPGGNNLLNVEYSCRIPPIENPEFFVVAPQNEEITLTCPPNTNIFIKRSYYGYGGTQDDTTVTVRGICSLQSDSKCTYKPAIPEFNDFDGFWDFNTVYYYCSGGLTTVGTQYMYVEEGGRVNMTCPTGQVLDIDSAFYGAGGFQGDVSVVVKGLCESECNCSFLVNYELFLDPRAGSKHLTIGYTCRAPRWNDLTYVTVNHDGLGMIDCNGQYIYIGEAFYGGGYTQVDVTANRIWDRCETRWPAPMINSYCVFGARDLYFGTVGLGKLTVGYYCSPHLHSDHWMRRTPQYLFGTGENRDGSYTYEFTPTIRHY